MSLLRTILAFSLLRELCLKTVKRTLCGVNVIIEWRGSLRGHVTQHAAMYVSATNGRKGGKKHIPVMSCNQPLNPASIAAEAASASQPAVDERRDEED